MEKNDSRFLIAPLMTPSMFMVIHLSGRISGPKDPSAFAFDPGLYIFIGAYAYLATAIFGVPSYFLFRALHWTNIFLFIVGGTVIGFVVSLIFMHNSPLFGFLTLIDRVGFALAGALSALAFRVIALGLNINARVRAPISGET